jgi:hypothetical protein
MEDLKIDLKKCLNNYRNLDDQLRQLNKLVYDLREKRKIVELEMGDILKNQHLAQVGLLKLENDNSVIKIQRPGTYAKPWSLSKRDLENYIDHYFENAGPNPNREECFNFIVEQQKLNSVESDFKFTRTIPNENIDIE